MGGHLFLLLGVCSFCYAKIMLSVRKSKKAMQPISLEKYAISDGTISARSAGARGPKRKLLPSKYDIDVAKTLLLLMAIFYICFLPIGVKVLVRLFCGMPAPQPVWMLNFEQFGILFAMLSPCLDPFVYGWRNKQLRATIADMFGCNQKPDMENLPTESTAPSQSAPTWAWEGVSGANKQPLRTFWGTIVFMSPNDSYRHSYSLVAMQWYHLLYVMHPWGELIRRPLLRSWLKMIFLITDIRVGRTANAMSFYCMAFPWLCKWWNLPL